MTTWSMEDITEARGQTVYSQEGEKIGSVEEIYYDYETRQPEWLGLGTGFLGTKRAIVPLAGAERREDGLAVPYSKDQVQASPDVDGEEISEELERRLYEHYGVPYSEARSDTVLAEGTPGTRGTGTDRTAREGEGTVTRHEEELRVGTRQSEAGRARLRKWVETEPVAEDVELRRERARVTREPVDRAAGQGQIGEEEVEVPLRREEPVVQKETVARERVGLEKDVETERETVADEVRKERVEVEGDLEER